MLLIHGKCFLYPILDTGNNKTKKIHLHQRHSIWTRSGTGHYNLWHNTQRIDSNNWKQNLNSFGFVHDKKTPHLIFKWLNGSDLRIGLNPTKVRYFPNLKMRKLIWLESRNGGAPQILLSTTEIAANVNRPSGSTRSDPMLEPWKQVIIPLPIFLPRSLWQRRKHSLPSLAYYHWA